MRNAYWHGQENRGVFIIRGDMRKIIGIDFDGTCVVDSYPYVGDNIGAAKVLRE